jgi:hypothetical protein
MNSVSPLKHGVVDLAAIFFIIGGVVGLVLTLLTIPISSLYPFTIPLNFSTTFVAVLAISLVCSFGAIHCYSLTAKRMLSEAGMRGIIFGALLLIFSLGVVSNASVSVSNSTALLTSLSAGLIIIAGIVCFALRHTNISASGIARQHVISQPAYNNA